MKKENKAKMGGGGGVCVGGGRGREVRGNGLP